MNLQVVGIFVAILMVGSAVGEGDPTIVIKYKKLEINTADNPYFDTVTYEVSKSGELGSAKLPLKKTFPSDTAMVSTTIEFEGNQLVEFEDLICEMMHNKVYGEDLLNHGLPAENFPTECPVSPGTYEIHEYPLPKDKFPAGTPDGDYLAKMIVGEPDKDPWIVIHAIIEISHEAPKLPAPGIGR